MDPFLHTYYNYQNLYTYSTYTLYIYTQTQMDLNLVAESGESNESNDFKESNKSNESTNSKEKQEHYVLLLDTNESIFWPPMFIPEQDFATMFEVIDNGTTKYAQIKKSIGTGSYFDTYLCSYTLDHIRGYIRSGKQPSPRCIVAIYSFLYTR
jgi:hypothetical protein